MLSRLKRILILAACFVALPVLGKATKVPKKVSKIIVIPTGKLGDVVCCTPVLRAIRKHLPEAQIIVAGYSKLHIPLLSDSGLADEYLDLERPGRLGRVRKVQADVAIVTGPSFLSVALLYLAGIPLIISPAIWGGDPKDVTRTYKMVQKLVRTFPYQMGVYSPRERLRSLEPLGIIEENTAKKVGFSEDANKKIENLISKISSPYKYLVGMSAAAGNKEKQWPAKNFAMVADYLIERHDAQLILIGSNAEKSEAKEVEVNIINKEKFLDTTGILTLDELKSIISKLDLFISVNTGPLYIAEAFDIPTVDILGPVNPWDQPPQGQIHKMVFPPGNPKPLINMMDTRSHDVKEAIKIALSTRLEDVIEAVEDALLEVDKKKAQKG